MAAVQKMFTSLFRSVGQGLDKMGRSLEINPHIERLQPATQRVGFRGKKPELKCSFIASSASVIGNVKIGEHSSVWYQAVVRGDVNPIVIGDNVAICDRAMIHCSGGHLDAPTNIGNRVHIGVGATVHGATLEDECKIGDMATVLDHAVVKKHSIIAPGAVVSPKTVVPSGQLWSGIPAKYERDLTLEEISQIGYTLSDTADLAFVHADEQSKTWEQIVQEADDLEENENRNSHYCQVTPEKVKRQFLSETIEGYTIPGRLLNSNIAPSGEERRGGFYESDESDRSEVYKNFGIDENSKKEGSK